MDSVAVRALDRYLNRQILLGAEPTAAWHTKVRAKRLLALARPGDVDRLALRILAVLRRARRQDRTETAA